MSVELVVNNTQPSLDMAMPVARIRGEVMTELPTDLFIPPDALSVVLEQFEGPLDFSPELLGTAMVGLMTNFGIVLPGAGSK